MNIRTAIIAFIACAGVTACASLRRGEPAGYVLPFPEGEGYRLIQGNDGRYGHVAHLAFSYDFRMPIGSTVTAARAGVVVAIEEQFADGTRTAGQENYVFIRHADGSFARYYHLTAQGALVGIGDRVRRGQSIGRSGSSGASAGPHLHFDVTRDCPEFGCQTVAISFSNANPASLREGETYLAGPY